MRECRKIKLNSQGCIKITRRLAESIALDFNYEGIHCNKQTPSRLARLYGRKKIRELYLAHKGSWRSSWNVE